MVVAPSGRYRSDVPWNCMLAEVIPAAGVVPVLTRMYALAVVPEIAARPRSDCSFLSGRIAIEVAAGVDPVGQRGHLTGAERRLPENHDREVVEDGGRHLAHVERRERVQSLVPQDLGQVEPEAVRRGRQYQHGLRRRLGREGRGRVGGQRRACEILDAARAALDGQQVRAAELECRLRGQPRGLGRSVVRDRGGDVRAGRRVGEPDGGRRDRRRQHRLVEGRRDGGADATPVAPGAGENCVTEGAVLSGWIRDAASVSISLAESARS